MRNIFSLLPIGRLISAILLLIVSAPSIFGQAFSATWNLTGNNTVSSSSGNISATAMAKGSAVGTVTYGSCGGAALGFPTAASRDNTAYYEYAITPAAGYNLTISSVSWITDGSSSSTASCCHAWHRTEARWSTDNFSSVNNSIGLNAFTSPTSCTNNNPFSSLNISVSNGTTLKVRIYGYEMLTSSTYFLNRAVTISGTSALACTAPASVTFSAGATSLCVGGTSTYTASAASGTTPITMSYSVASGASINSSTGVVSSVTGNFTVVATATNACGNISGNRSVTVNSLPSVTVSANPSTVCINTSTTLTAVPSGGSGSYSSYAWSSASGGNGLAASTAVTATATPTTTGSKTYSVVVTDSNNCSSSAGSTAVSAVGTSVTTTTPATNISSTGATLGGTIQ